MSELRDQLQAAMAGTSDEVPPAPIIPEPTPEPVATPDLTAEAAPIDGQPRDETGKFAPKIKAEEPAPAAAAPVEPTIQAETPAGTEPETQAIRIPPSLPAAIKAKFATLEPDVRDAITKLEDSVQTAKAEWGKKGERLNAFEEIIAPHRDAWALQGLDDRGALQRLVAAEKVLRETPAQGIVALAQLYGVNLQSLIGQNAPGAQAQPQQAQPEAHPEFAALQSQLQTLQEQLAQQTQAKTDTELASARQQIAEFSGKPENMYFDNVKDDVADRLQSGRAKTLAEAYEHAIWASPEIRPLLLAAQETEKAKKASDDAARAKAASAKAASGSVTGAPTPGAAPANGGPRSSLREELLASVQEHSAAL